MQILNVSLSTGDRLSISERAEFITELQKEEKKLYALSAELTSKALELTQNYQSEMKALSKKQEVLADRLGALQESMQKSMIT